MNQIALKELCSLTMGQSPSSDTYNDEQVGYPFYQGNADFGKLHPCARMWCDKPKKMAKKDDILISVRAPIGSLNIATEDCCIGRGLAAITVNSSKSDMLYLFYALSAYNTILQNKGTGSTFKAINKNALEELLIPDYSKEKQVEIGQVLQKVDQLIDTRNKQLSKLDELVKSRFIEMFGDLSCNKKKYPIKRLKDIAIWWNGLTYKPSDIVDASKGVLVLRSSNIQDSELAFYDNVYVGCSIKEKYLVQNNDILMCSRNGSAALVGKCALIKDIKKPMAFGAFMMNIRSSYYPYLKVYFQTSDFRRQIATGTTTINQITGKMLENVKVIVPGIDEVSKFADFLRGIDKSKMTIQKSLDELETLKKSLMQQYFG